MTYDLNDADDHLSDYHRQLFGRVDRYYAGLAAGGSPARSRRPWPVVAAFTLGAALAFLLASLVLPGTAAALPEKLARPVAAVAPADRTAADIAAFKSQATRAAEKAAMAAARRAEAARIHAALVLATEYQNPLRAVSGLYPERVDMGVDFGGTGPVYAVGPGIIQATYNSGWPGGGWICELLTGGRDAGLSVYVAEDVTASVSYDERVTSATVLGTMWGGIETGWAQAGCGGNAAAGYYPNAPTSYGQSYESLLVSMGVPASGSTSTTAAPVTVQHGSGTWWPGTAFGQCVRQAENGGSYAWGTGNGGGAYQFLASTWAAYASGAPYGSATQAQQDQAFQNAVVASGDSAWAPYDGCTLSASIGAGPIRTSNRASITGTIRPLDQGKPPGTSHARCTWRCYPRNRAMDWALHERGCPYSWGGTGCSPGFDCSGLVMMAYASIGIHLPRTTGEMLADVGHRHYLRRIWWVLLRTFHPKRGDLAFYGSGHVELDTKLHHTTFGAHDYGSPVSYASWGWGWAPTAFYRVHIHRRSG